jgi:hypothetical protein
MFVINQWFSWDACKSWIAGIFPSCCLALARRMEARSPALLPLLALLLLSRLYDSVFEDLSRG